MAKPAGLLRPAPLLYSSFWTVLDWLFPPTCGGCGKTGVRWCEPCQNQIQPITSNFCPVCGDLLPLPPSPAGPSPAGDSALCANCRQRPPAFQELRSYGVFQGPLRKAIHRLKYQKDVGMGEALSKHLIELYNHLKWEIDWITPVPLNKTRERERGYNQSGLLGRPLAYAVQKPYRPDVIKRSRNTHSQVGLNAAERQKNVEDAFSIRTDQVRGKVILIVDDVATTGSTINACARALRDAGASAVYGLTLARAAPQADADDRPIPS